MFGSKENKNKSAAPAPRSGNNNSLSNSPNTLVRGTIVEGKIKSRNDIRIEGRVVGSIKCDSKVIIGASGYVEGDVNCQNAVIEGELQGDIIVNETLKLEKSAKVEGKISTLKFIVAPGAVFNGTCRMGQQNANVTAGKVASIQKEAS